MCWKHEKEYCEACFDFLWEDCGLYEEDCVVNLLKGFGIYFVDHEKEMEARNKFFEFLDKCHDEGLIEKSE